MAQPDIDVGPSSLRAVSDSLGELSRAVVAGQFKRDSTGWTDAPYGHAELADAARPFSKYAHHQVQNLAVLFLSLSFQVADAASAYEELDDAVASNIDKVLRHSTYRSADQRASCRRDL